MRQLWGQLGAQCASGDAESQGSEVEESRLGGLGWAAIIELADTKSVQ